MSKRECVDIDVANLDKRIAIQTNTQSTDSQGGYSDSWATTFSIWAAVKPMRQNEIYRGQKIDSPATVRFTTRYDSRIDTAKRILYDSRTFNITEVINVNERNWKLEILATENVPT